MRTFSDALALYSDILNEYMDADVEFTAEGYLDDIEIQGIPQAELISVYQALYKTTNGDYVLCIRKDTYSYHIEDGCIYVSGEVCSCSDAVGDNSYSGDYIDFLNRLNENNEYVFIRADEYADDGDIIENMLVYDFVE